MKYLNQIAALDLFLSDDEHYVGYDPEFDDIREELARAFGTFPISHRNDE